MDRFVLEPDTDVYYYFTSTISASVARADIATHANFQPLSGETGTLPPRRLRQCVSDYARPPCQRHILLQRGRCFGPRLEGHGRHHDLTAASAGDMARYDGTDWIKIANLIGGEVEALTLTETCPTSSPLR